MRKNILLAVITGIFIIVAIVHLLNAQEEPDENPENFFNKIKDFFRNLFGLPEENLAKGEKTAENKLIGNEEQDEQQTTQETLPVLENLGIFLDAPNIQTKRAGDLLFDKKVVWEDEGSYSDKSFGEFGELGKRKDTPNSPGVEYNYAVPIGTKVHAAGGGVVRVFYIEHTQDWGINIQPEEGSQWNIGQEHIVNLNVKDGDMVKAGDVLGEATPNKMDYATTQLSVWTGGKGIIKYCPFPFLENNLKPEYEERINQIAEEWEKFIGKDVYKQEDWVLPGCLLQNITER